MLRLSQAATLLLVPTCLLSSANAIEIIGNLPSNDLTSSDLRSDFSKAAGFTMPSGVPYTLDSVVVSLLVDTLGAETVWSFGLFADLSGNPDIATPLVNLPLPVLPLSDTTYSLTPAVPFTLQPNTTYWLVGSSSSASSYGGWNRNDPAKTPSGLAAPAGARSENPPTTVNNFYNSFSIQGTPVPGPLPLLGAGAAFGASRRLRRRVQASRPGASSLG